MHHLHVACCLRTANSSIVMSVVHICISTALGDVPTKLLIWKFCLRLRKKISMSPPCFVEVCDGSRRKLHFIGEQHHREVVFSVIYGNPAYTLGVLSGRSVSCQPHNFVYELLRMGFAGQVTFLNALIDQIVLQPDDEEYLSCFPRWDTQAPPSLLSPTRHDQPA